MKSGKGIQTKNVKTGFHDKSEKPFAFISSKTQNKIIYIDDPQEMRSLANWLLSTAAKIEKKLKEKK